MLQDLHKLCCSC